MSDKKININKLIGCPVTCNAPNHKGVYMCFTVCKERNTAFIQRPEEWKGHWVNIIYLTLVDPDDIHAKDLSYKVSKKEEENNNV